jgi:hypothetical protein
MTERPGLSLLWLGVPTLVLALLFWSAFEPVRLNWGDPTSDFNATTAGRYFRDYGFLPLRLTPVLDIGPLRDDSLRYTHYPPLPDLVNGAWQSLGLSELWQFRWAALVVSALGAAAFGTVVSRLYGGYAAIFSVVLLTTNLLWVQYADSLHHIPLQLLFANLSLLACVAWLQHMRRRHLIALVPTTVLALLSSYDVWFSLPLLGAAAPWLVGRSWRDRACWSLVACLGGAVVLGVAIKFGLAWWAQGDFETFIADLRFQGVERGYQRVPRPLEAIPTMLFWRALRFFTPLFLALVAIHGWISLRAVLRRSEAKEASLRASPFFFFLAGLPFLAVFPELFMRQIHPMLQWLPYYAVGLGVLAGWLWLQGFWGRASCVALVFFAVGWQVVEASALERALVSEQTFRRVRAITDSHGNRVVFSDLPIDSVVRYLLDRYPIDATWLSPMEVLPFTQHMMRLEGASKLYFVRSMQPGVAAYDKVINALPADVRLLGFPRPHRRKFQRAFETRALGLRNSFLALGSLRASFPELEVIELSLDKVQQAFDRMVLAHPTGVIDFSLRSASKFVVGGMWREQADFFSVGYLQQWEPYFTMSGLRWKPSGRWESETPSLRLNLRPGEPYEAHIELTSAVKDQSLTLEMNGHLLDTIVLAGPGKATMVSFSIPAEVLSADGLQTLGLHFSEQDPQKRAAAIYELRISARLRR